jgi:hypothetical protein
VFVDSKPTPLKLRRGPCVNRFTSKYQYNADGWYGCSFFYGHCCLTDTFGRTPVVGQLYFVTAKPLKAPRRGLPGRRLLAPLFTAFPCEPRLTAHTAKAIDSIKYMKTMASALLPTSTNSNQFLF